MDLMQLRAMAKINLGLDVVRKREDGYHEVRMIMQTIRMFDRVTVYRIPEPEIRISSNLHFLPVNENNIAYKAARMMLESQPVRGGVSISLQKRIPVAAGMAGGSAERLFDDGVNGSCIICDEPNLLYGLYIRRIDGFWT